MYIVIVKGSEIVQSYVDLITIGASPGTFRLGDMFAMLFFFALLLFLLRKFAWGPLMKIMQEREEYVSNEIDAAEQSREEASIAAKEAAAQLLATKQEAQKIIEDAKSAGVEQEQSIIAAAAREAERLKQEAQTEIQNEKEKALQALQEQVASLSVLIASKVIEKELSATDQEELISEYIKEVGEEQ